MDGTTDAGRVEDELVAVMYCSKDDVCREVKSKARFIRVVVPERADANGLIACAQKSLGVIGAIDILSKDSVLSVKPVLIGGGTDGASVNIAEQNGMKGKMQQELPWLFWSWCYAHRLELACKDSFTSNLFTSISDMLLQLFYLYSKSPKKLRELSDVVSDLGDVFEFSKGGDAPVRSHGSRWISHKRQALQRIVDRYGAYITHLTALHCDSSVKASDKARLKGYLAKWQEAKILIGSAMYVDCLKAPSLLSKALQGEKADIVMCLKNILNSKRVLTHLVHTNPLQWPTVKLVLDRISDDKEYQGATLHHFSESVVTTCKDQVIADISRLEIKMRERLEWSDANLLRAILMFLDTQSWMCSDSETEKELLQPDKNLADELSLADNSLAKVSGAVELIATTFRAPLEAVGINLLVLQDQIIEVVEYARCYLSIESDDYHKVWYKLYICPDATKWKDILVLCDLCFSLPFSNGSVERMFSTLKLIKTDRRTRLKDTTLSDLLEIQVEGPSLTDFCPKPAVEAWWHSSNTARRPNQRPRKQYASRKPGTSSQNIESSSDEDQDILAIDEWDRWFGSERNSDSAV